MKFNLSRYVGVCSLITALALSACDSSQSANTPATVPPPVAIPNNSTTPDQGAPQGQNQSTPGTPLTASASGPLSGKEIQFTTFGIQYAYDQDKAWALTFSVAGPDLSAGNPVYLVAWRLYDKARQSYLTDWEISDRNPDGIYYPGTMAFSFAVRDASQVAQVINAQNSAVLLLSVNGSEGSLITTHYIDLGANCSTHPDQFLNLSDGKNGCEQVTTARPPALPTSPNGPGRIHSIQGTIVSSAVCDSKMRMGFFSGNETGIFTYTSSPPSVSVSVNGKKVVITDTTKICTLPASATDLPLAVTTQLDENSATSIQINSKNSTDLDNPDGGTLWLSAGQGGFECPSLPPQISIDGPAIVLSNCRVK